ncbi:glycosyltransferase family 1 protein [Roseomonas sp. AR75]|uniref:glycosyltransferase family 4 protein n=1 Tax=Roseomonas sp. AR75 TaxID=2562311 RepID=UPI0010BF824D|nr:glycosyltransferase family 1 protein [Roseomonas sp. AR75]
MTGAAKPALTLDIAPLLEDQWTGIPVFTRRLVQALERSGEVDLSFAVRLTRIPATRLWDTVRAGFGTFLRTDFEHGLIAGLDRLDAASPLLYPSVKSACGVCGAEASVIHDVSTLVMPETHAEANVRYHLDPLREQLATDEVVFCASEATRAALVAAYPSASAKARVIYQYADWPEEFALDDRNLPRLALGRYAAVIGTIEPRKNLGLLLRALSHPALRDSDLRFVVIGKKGWNLDAALAGLDPAQHKRILFTDFVSEFAKYRLLRAAEFLVFPSIYEGFGIPAVEAMHLGKPVLAAFTSSFPEVIGEAGVYFDPLSVDEFAAAFEEISNPARVAELAPKAVEQARQFNAARMAAPVLEWLKAR